MKNKCLAAVERYHMLSSGDTVVVGVSGGADSMALLHFLHLHTDFFGIRVIAAHFHHGIRGAEADRDQSFVRAFCNANGIDFVTARENIPEKSLQMHMSLEECARVSRYEFLQSVCRNAKIATAHTNSDACESFLFNFARGTGLQGLCGIPAVRENIIRPLIFCSAQDTREYCSAHGISWCEDSSNSCDDYARNSVRLNTVPTLKKINPQFEENALRCMRILQSENDFILQAVENAYHACVNKRQELSLDNLSDYHDAVRTRVLLRFVRESGCKDVSMKQIERLLLAEDGEKLTLGGAVRFVKQNGTLSVVTDHPRSMCVCVPVDETTESIRFFDSLVIFKHYVYNNETLSNYNIFIDADKLHNPVLRTRKEGDKLRLKKRNCTKTIKQLFSENHIPASERTAWPVLADDSGVIWIGGFGIDESRIADKNTKNFLKIEWRKTI